MPTLSRRNKRSDQMLSTEPAARRSAPATTSAVEGRSGRLVMRSGNCAASAMSRPFGGSTAGFVTVESVMIVSSKRPAKVVKRGGGRLHLRRVEWSCEAPEHRAVDGADLFPERPAF